MADEHAQLTLEKSRQVFKLPIYESSQGDRVVDIQALGKEALYTFDPGYTATASCESKITFIDGEKGVLLYRGYPVEQLAESSNFLEVCHLIAYGELPTSEELAVLEKMIQHNAAIDPQLVKILKNFESSVHPMAALCTLVAAVSAKYHDTVAVSCPAGRKRVIEHIVAQMPVLAAMIYRHSRGLPANHSRPELSYSENFLHMMFSSSQSCEIDPVICKAMDLIFLLHADHEQNASTSTVRLVGSTGSDPYMAIASGIAALWGPAHGGANEAVLRMLDDIGDESRIEEFIAKAQDKNDPFRLMGFGHRVYKSFDPRAAVMKRACHDVLAALGLEGNTEFRIALKLEKIALENAYFVKRKLYPNVDFYSGVILKAIGIPINMLTVIFAVGRTPGWISQWNEMVAQGCRIGRPRQLYTGSTLRDYVPMSQR